MKPSPNKTITLLGIDCATKPEKTGLALAIPKDRGVRVLDCNIGSNSNPPIQTAVRWLKDYDHALIALDAPLGWPKDLGRELSSHQAGNHIRTHADQMFSRLTDIEIRNRLGKKPLEVGADRIARTALAALNLLDEIRKATGRAIPLAWEAEEKESWRAIEVYPAATRLAHGTDGKGGSLDGLEEMIDCSLILGVEKQSHDAIDAIVCTLAAADFLLGRAVPPEDMETARTEGWIWAPEKG